MDDFTIIKILGKKARNYKKKEIKILNSAILLFSKKSFYATKTKEIAKNGNISEGTIFNYFDRKEDILDKIIYITKTDIIDNIKIEIENYINTIINDKNIDKVRSEIVEIIVKNIINYKIILKAVLPELVRDDEDLNEIKEKYINTLKLIIEYLNKKIEIDKLSIEYVDFEAEKEKITLEIIRKVLF